MADSPNDFGYKLKGYLRDARRSMFGGDINLPVEEGSRAAKEKDASDTARRSGLDTLRKLATPVARRKP